MEDRVQRKRRLTPEQKWQVFLEASRKNATDAEVCRRWGITPWQLRAIRDRVKDGATEALAKGPGRPRKDLKVADLEQVDFGRMGLLHDPESVASAIT
ncbi:hypothetical protein BH20ACT24_BH20ACT24_02470 [soil metagenome]